MVKNRDHWTVTAIHQDRSVTLAGATGSIQLPADYAAQHVKLGYAQTSHANQGRTVDTSLLLVDGPTDSRGVYTPMTRGRHANHAYVVTEDSHTSVDVLAHAVTRDWIDRPAIDRRAQLDSHLHQNPTPRLRTRLGPHEPTDIWLTDQRRLAKAEQQRTSEMALLERRIQQLMAERRARLERERNAYGKRENGLALER